MNFSAFDLCLEHFRDGKCCNSVALLGLYFCSSKAKKYFLCLLCGPPSVSSALPKAKGLDGEESESGEEDDREEDENGTVST